MNDYCDHCGGWQDGSLPLCSCIPKPSTAAEVAMVNKVSKQLAEKMADAMHKELRRHVIEANWGKPNPEEQSHAE